MKNLKEFLAGHARAMVPGELKARAVGILTDNAADISNVFTAFSTEQIDFYGVIRGFQGEMRRINSHLGSTLEDAKREATLHPFAPKKKLEHSLSLVRRRSEIETALGLIVNQSEDELFKEGGFRKWIKTATLEAARPETPGKVLNQINRRMAVHMMETAATIMILNIGWSTKDDLGEDKLGLGNMFDLWNFMDCGALSAKISGVSLLEVFKPSGEKVTPERFYRFVVGSHLLRRGANPKADIANNLTRPIWKDNPSLTSTFITKASAQANAFYFSEPEVLDQEFDFSRVGEQIRERAKRLHSQFDENLRRMRSVLLNPKSPDFQALKTAINDYRGRGRIENIVALSVALDGSARFIKDLYRVAQKNIADGVEKEFYTDLLDALIVLIDDSPKTAEYYTAKDAEVFFDEENGDSAVDVRNLEKRAIAISNMTSERTFSIDPSSIELGGIVQPSNIELTIDKSNPRKLTITFNYLGEEQSDSIFFEIDTKKYAEGLDWSFVDLPSSMPRIRNSLLYAANLILQKIEGGLKDAMATKQSPPHTIETVEGTKAKRKKIRPLPENTQSNKRKAIAPRETFTKIVPELITLPEIGRTILVPDEVSFSKLLSSLHPVDQQNVRESIGEFNSRGAGGFQKIHAREVLYSLRVKSTAPSGIRIILREIQSSDRTRRFEIVSLGYRRNAYRGVGGKSRTGLH